MWWYEFLYLMLKHCYTLSVRSSEIYSTGEVSFHAEGASDQYFLGTQYLPPRWPTLSISTSILLNSCVVSYIKYDCWKRGGFICSSDFEMRVYLLRGKFETVEVLFATWKLSRFHSLSVQCGQITALLRNYTAPKSKIQTNVIHSFYTLCNGYTTDTQRWAHANLWWITNGNGGGAEKELTCKVGRHVSYIIPLSFKILDTSSTLPLQI